MAAPGGNQVLNDIIWKDGTFGTALAVQAFDQTTPDYALEDLSATVTLKKSTFHTIGYFDDLIQVHRQTLNIKKSLFSSITIANPHCSDCRTSLINCRTSAVHTDDVAISRYYTRTTDAYCSIVNSCFYDVEATQTIVTIQEHGYGSVAINRETNFVFNFNVVGTLPPEQTCEHGQGLLPTSTGTDFVACFPLADVDYCPLYQDPPPESADPPYTSDNEEDKDNINISEDDNDDHPNGIVVVQHQYNQDYSSMSADGDDYFPLHPQLSKRQPSCSERFPCDQCEGDVSLVDIFFLFVPLSVLLNTGCRYCFCHFCYSVMPIGKKYECMCLFSSVNYFLHLMYFRLRQPLQGPFEVPPAPR